MDIIKWILICSGSFLLIFSGILENILDDNTDGYIKINKIKIDITILFTIMIFFGLLELGVGLALWSNSKQDIKYDLVYNEGDKPANKYYNIDHVDVSDDKTRITFRTADGAEITVSNVTYYILTELD